MTRGALRVLLAAFAASAALLVLQTLVYQVLPYDSTSFGAVAVALRVAFCAADVALLAGFAMTVRDDKRLRGFGVPGLLLSTFAVAAGLAGLGASVLGPSSDVLGSLDRTLGGAEPILSLGAALLALFALGASGTRRSSAFAIIVWLGVVVSLGFRIAHLASPGPRSLVSAWLSWASEVIRPLTLAAFAFVILREATKARASTSSDDADKNPYREPGEGPAPPAAPTLGTPDAAAAEKIRTAAGGLSLYRAVFLTRVGIAFIATIIVLFASALRGGGERAAIALVLTMIPLSGLATAILMGVALLKMLSLPRASEARALLVGAVVAVAGLVGVELVTLAGIALSMTTSSSYRAVNDMAEVLAIEWPTTLAVAGVALLFIAAALARVGEKLMVPDVVAYARWVQAVTVAVGATLIGLPLAVLGWQSASWGYGRSSAGGLACAGIGFFAFGGMVLVIVLTVLLASAARRALLVYARAP